MDAMPTTAPFTNDALISLRAGFTVRVSVLTWLIDASFRLRFSILADGRLHVAPRNNITASDEIFIREHRDELVAAVRYYDEQAGQPT